ncbi:MAG: hypothetical protein ACYDER_29745, partial [Ktedonobacteraceae bacterium]
SEGLQSAEKMRVVCVPQWSSKYGRGQRTIIEWVTFERQRLADPEFNPFDPSLPWAATILLDQSALHELVILLEQHTLK